MTISHHVVRNFSWWGIWGTSPSPPTSSADTAPSPPLPPPEISAATGSPPSSSFTPQAPTAAQEAALTGSNDVAGSAVTDVISLSDSVQISSTLYTGDHIGDLVNLGLVHWTPVGAVEVLLEQLHVNLGLPWWTAIVLLSLLGRAIIAPLLIRSQVNNVRLAKIRPELEKLMQKLQEAKARGDKISVNKNALASRQLFKENDCSPTRSLTAPLVQLPIALSCFIAIRKMSELPVESLKTGGALWFTDLTVADPYYILPLVSAASIYGMMDVST